MTDNGEDLVKPAGSDNGNEQTQKQIDDRNRERIHRALGRVPQQLTQIPAPQLAGMLVTNEAIVRMLIEKGICTLSEYLELNAKTAEETIPHTTAPLIRIR